MSWFQESMPISRFVTGGKDEEEAGLEGEKEKEPFESRCEWLAGTAV
jgi:hypothetical protein